MLLFKQKNSISINQLILSFKFNSNLNKKIFAFIVLYIFKLFT